MENSHGLGSVSLVPTIGASGAIYGICWPMAVVLPDRRVWIFPIPVTIPCGFCDHYGRDRILLGTIGDTGDDVSHVCHLGGMLVGYIYLRRGSFLYSPRNFFSDWKRRRMRKKFEVYQRDHRDKPPSRPDNWLN